MQSAPATREPPGTVGQLVNKVIFDVVADENSEYAGVPSGSIAQEQGRDPWDVLCDIVIADDLLTSFGTPTPRESDEDWRTRVEFWRDPRVVIGASDAGAHLDLFATFNYPTVLLAKAVRERGLLPLEEAVHLMTDVPARLYGLWDAGESNKDGTRTSSCSTPRRSRAMTSPCGSTSLAAPAASTPERKASNTCLSTANCWSTTAD